MRIIITLDVEPSDDPEMFDEGHLTGLTDGGHNKVVDLLSHLLGSVVSIERGF